MKFKKSWIIWCFALCLLTPNLYAAAATATRNTCQARTTCFGSITWQGVKRTFAFYLPDKYTDLRRYHTLIIALHGAGSSGNGLEGSILQGSLNTIADHNRTIIVYPDAIDGTWNDTTTRKNANVDDVGFLRALMQYFMQNYFTNPNRNYIVGMSNGGFMAYRMACESADMVSAIATVAAAMPTTLVANCRPKRHISVLMINGTQDPVLPWNSHQMLNVISDNPDIRLTVPETFQAWLKIDNITKAPHQYPVATATGYDGTWVWSTDAIGNDRTEVILYTIYGGGHAWPGGAQYLPAQSIGNISRHINGSAIIWKFLVGHRLVPLPIFDIKHAVIKAG